jgi:BirA family biotin operon repressor/biotin-[acetyl-CoA-carboxylase] ligase
VDDEHLPGAAAPRAPWRVRTVASTGSTNADVAALAADGEPEGLVLAAAHQHAGRGRLDRTWTAPPGAALAVSVLLRPGTTAAPPGPDRPAVDRTAWAWLPLLAGVSLTDALATVLDGRGVPAVLKWPNDVLLDGAKVAGILAEVAGNAVVLGTGVNLTQAREELPVPTATSLRLAGALTTDADTVLAAYLDALAARYDAWRAAAGDPEASGLGPAYRRVCATVGVAVRVLLPGAPPVTGHAEAVDGHGRLVVRDAAGSVHAFAAGDVHHVRPG